MLPSIPRISHPRDWKYLLENPQKITEIALAGQKRTLKEHTYEIRMKELLEILKKYI